MFINHLNIIPTPIRSLKAGPREYVLMSGKTMGRWWSDPLSSDCYEIRLDGQVVGKLFVNEGSYGPGRKPTICMNPIRWMGRQPSDRFNNADWYDGGPCESMEVAFKEFVRKAEVMFAYRGN